MALHALFESDRWLRAAWWLRWVRDRYGVLLHALKKMRAVLMDLPNLVVRLVERLRESQWVKP